MKLETSVIPLFQVILSGKSISGIIFVISGDLHGQKVYFKVKVLYMLDNIAHIIHNLGVGLGVRGQ